MGDTMNKVYPLLFVFGLITSTNYVAYASKKQYPKRDYAAIAAKRRANAQREREEYLREATAYAVLVAQQNKDRAERAALRLLRYDEVVVPVVKAPKKSACKQKPKTPQTQDNTLELEKLKLEELKQAELLKQLELLKQITLTKQLNALKQRPVNQQPVVKKPANTLRPIAWN